MQLSDFLKSAGSPAMQHLIEQNKKKDRYLSSVPFTWLVKVDARVRVVDCLCKVCATHVTSNMHPAAACRDSCDNPILVKSSWTSDWFPPGSLDTCVN